MLGMEGKGSLLLERHPPTPVVKTTNSLWCFTGPRWDAP